jgi:hypothetical protein
MNLNHYDVPSNLYYDITVGSSGEITSVSVIEMNKPSLGSCWVLCSLLLMENGKWQVSRRFASKREVEAIDFGSVPPEFIGNGDTYFETEGVMHLDRIKKLVEPYWSLPIEPSNLMKVRNFS